MVSPRRCSAAVHGGRARYRGGGRAAQGGGHRRACNTVVIERGHWSSSSLFVISTEKTSVHPLLRKPLHQVRSRHMLRLAAPAAVARVSSGCKGPGRHPTCPSRYLTCAGVRKRPSWVARTARSVNPSTGRDCVGGLPALGAATSLDDGGRSDQIQCVGTGRARWGERRACLRRACDVASNGIASPRPNARACDRLGAASEFGFPRRRAQGTA